MLAKNRNKVLFLITKANGGGAQRYVYDLATHLDPQNWEVVVAFGGGDTLRNQLGHAGIRTITLPELQNSLSFTSALRALMAIIRVIRSERPTILHCNSSVAGLLGVMAGRCTRVPGVIFTAHGWASNEDRPYWQRRLLQLLHWSTVLLSHRTIAVSRALVSELPWPGVARRTTVIHPGRTIGAMYSAKAARAALIERFPALEPVATDPWIGIVAELHPIKRHQVLLSALAQLRDTHPHLRVIAMGEGAYAATLTAQVAAHNLESHWFFLGAVPEAARLFKAFTILTLPSKSESYGYVLHEAGIAHVPVVASAVGGVLDIVTHERSGILVPPDNPPALAAALDRLLSHPDQGIVFATTLHHELSTRTPQAMASATTALYTAVLRRHRGDHRDERPESAPPDASP
jgi:glycosyltransferase involved in cell wall biosynthesis